VEEWVQRLGPDDDAVAYTMRQYLEGQEFHFKQQAAQALRDFDRKQWRQWSRSLPRRAGRLRPGSLIFKHLALERWTEARDLHRRALRYRSQTAWHSLRIGIKRLRYIVENFLPEQHAAWSNDLKELQDVLGEVHDLDVLWTTAMQISAFPDAESRSRWHGRIREERAQRIAKYRSKMVGKESLWQLWRAELPQGKQIEAAALSRLKRWGAFLDPDFKHAIHVSRLALQLYDGLQANGVENGARPEHRAILYLSALLHDVGLSEKQGGHQKASYRLIRKLKPPLGWSEESLKIAAAVARYHRGALPKAGQKALSGLNAEQRRTVVQLSGILRFANAFDSKRDHRIARVKVHQQNGVFTIFAEGYSSRDRMAEDIAAGRHLLETVYRRPVMVKPMIERKPRAIPSKRASVRVISSASLRG
jgi:HD superfamily phosphodiesterase